jgi:hypothetical protein
LTNRTEIEIINKKIGSVIFGALDSEASKILAGIQNLTKLEGERAAKLARCKVIEPVS